MTKIDNRAKNNVCPEICPKNNYIPTFLLLLRNRLSLSIKPNDNTTITDFMDEKQTVTLVDKSVF